MREFFGTLNERYLKFVDKPQQLVRVIFVAHSLMSPSPVGHRDDRVMTRLYIRGCF